MRLDGSSSLTVDLVSGGLQPSVPVAEVQRLLLALGGGEEDPAVRWCGRGALDGGWDPRGAGAPKVPTGSSIRQHL